MELYDILDRNGIPTGKRAQKGTMPKTGTFYLGVHAYIYNSKKEFLLQQRAFDKAFRPGGWDIHMGHVIAGETSKEGMIREISEEIGIYFNDEDMRFVGRVVWENSKASALGGDHLCLSHNHITDIYFLEYDYTINNLSLQENEVIGAKSVTKDEMLALVERMNYRPAEYRDIVKNEINKL